MGDWHGIICTLRKHGSTQPNSVVCVAAMRQSFLFLFFLLVNCRLIIITRHDQHATRTVFSYYYHTFMLLVTDSYAVRRRRILLAALLIYGKDSTSTPHPWPHQNRRMILAGSTKSVPFWVDMTSQPGSIN